MTKDDIIRMAREAGVAPSSPALGIRPADLAAIEGFAARVSAAEREACAQVAKSISDKYAFGYYGNEVDTADEIETAIRARGEKGRAA